MAAATTTATMSFLWVLAGLLILGLVLRLVIQYVIRQRCRRKYDVADGAKMVAFFHPYCNACGGGERVLWVAIKALAELHGHGHRMHVFIYSGDQGTTPRDILKRAEDHFGLNLVNTALPITFIFIPKRDLLEAKRYPVFTMLGQSLGSMVVAFMALLALLPDIFVDTTGCAFTYPVAKLVGGCKIAAYTHYPTISTDMLSVVRSQRPSYNNNEVVAGSRLKSTIKLIYYLGFAFLYSLCGALVDLIMVNSTWTRSHIASLWRLAATVHTLFPPCDTTSLQALALVPRQRVILSVGQFRPEKDHILQLKAFALLLKSSKKCQDVRLVLLGSCRGDEDYARVEQLKKLATEEGILDKVEFVVDAPFSELKRWLGRASVGLHAMWNEHFGICVVEYMAAGLITVAHNSGGPAMDIVVPYQGKPTGYLASTPEEYAQCLSQIFVTPLNPQEEVAMRERARASVTRFSDQSFIEGFSSLWTKAFLG